MCWLNSWLIDGIFVGEKVDAQRLSLGFFQTAQLRLFSAALVSGLGVLILRGDEIDDRFIFLRFVWLAAVSGLAMCWLKRWLTDGISVGEKVDAKRLILGFFQTSQLRLFPAALVGGLGVLILRG